jgi:Domain of unknown function (DUF4279)
MSEPHEYSAALRVFSSTRRLADLTSVLGEPTDSHDLGDPVSSRNPSGPKRQRSYWAYEPPGPRTARPLDDQLAELVEFAEAHRTTLEHRRAECRVDMFCGIFSGVDAQGGFELGPALVRRLADLDLRITFDIY